MLSAQMSKTFIGSSREAISIARAIQQELRDVTSCQLWSQGLFRVGSVVLEDLIKAVAGFDFGIFVFAPDDVLKLREEQYSAVRDNVVFELGIFIGRLGAQRIIFVVPEKDSKLHVPSDLAGIIPAKYDSDYSSRGDTVQVAVSSATFQISEAISALGPLQNRKRILFQSRRDPVLRILQAKESYIYKNDQHLGEKAQGRLDIGSDGLVAISRSNMDGRFEVHIRPQGPRNPSFTRIIDPLSPRPLHVTCSAKAEAARCKLRFVVKDENEDKWFGSESRTIEPDDWIKLEFYLWVDPTKDFLFRIDQEDVNGIPSKVLLKDLIIIDES